MTLTAAIAVCALLGLLFFIAAVSVMALDINGNRNRTSWD